MASATVKLAKHVLRLTRANNLNFHRVREKIRVIDGSPGHLRCEMLVEEQHCNCHGTLHGGMMVTLLDDIGGTANVTILKDGSPDIPALTVQQNMSYFSVVQPGETITITADIVKKGNTLAHATVSILNESGELVATGQNVLQLGKPRNGMSYNMFQ